MPVLTRAPRTVWVKPAPALLGAGQDPGQRVQEVRLFPKLEHRKRHLNQVRWTGANIAFRKFCLDIRSEDHPTIGKRRDEEPAWKYEKYPAWVEGNGTESVEREGHSDVRHDSPEAQ